LEEEQLYWRNKKIKINTMKVLNPESIVIIRIKGEHLLYSKRSGGMIGYGWGNVCSIASIRVCPIRPDAPVTAIFIIGFLF
jgi:hypothetical protein